MALTAEQFGKALVTSGLMTAEELRALWVKIPTDKRPKEGAAFAKLLVEQGTLNAFQSDELLSGRNTPLGLNQYTIVARIGAGGMGQVFKAQHRKMKRIVAIKLLPAAMTKDEAAIKRFQREVEAAAKLTHPNIVAALDADECRGMHYLVMECVEGQDLSALVKKQGPLTVEQSIDYILQAARGLAYAHAEGVVHRDIKPANLLVDKKGIVKILDMGLARIDNAGDAADHQLTNTGQVMGTVDYMAPEQATDTRMADARSDVYSLGCSLYRLLTGGNVYDGDTLIKKIMSHMSDPIPSLRAKRPDVPAELDRIFAKMMAKKPGDRYQQTSQLVAELEALRSPGGAPSQPSVVEQDSELQRFLSGVKDNKTNSPTATKAAVAPASATNVDEATAAFSSADATTDPKSEVIAPAVIASAQKAASGGRAPRVKSSKTKQPPLKLIAAGALGVVLVLLGIVVLIRDDKGNKVAEVVVPPGGSVEVKQTPPTVPAKAPTPPTTTSTTAAKLPTAPSSVAGNPAGTDFGLKFQDKSHNLKVPNPGVDLTRPFTVEAYVTPGTIPEKMIEALSLVGVNDEFALRISKNAWAVYFYHNTVPAATPMVPERRVHLAGVRTQTQKLLYVDGKRVASLDIPITGNNKHEVERPPLVIENSLLNFSFTIDELRITQGTPYTQDFTPPARFTADKDTLLLYHFDEGQGDVVNDSSGKNLHGKLTGGQWVRLDGKPVTSTPVASAPTISNAPASGDYALELRGFGNQPGGAAWVDVPSLSLSDSGPLTLEARVWVFGHNEGHVVGSDNLRLRQSGTNWTTDGSGIRPTQKSPYEYQCWYHLAAVRTANEVRMYVDGKHVESKPLGEKRGGKQTLSRPLMIGGNNANIRIDEVRVSKTARYDKDFTPALKHTPDADTLALYHCDEGSGDVLRDASGNKHDGKITQPSWVKPDGSPVPASAASPAGGSPGAETTNVVYLDDLPEIEWKDGLGRLGKHGLDRDGSPFTRQGKAFTHALFTHPLKDKAGIVHYALDGKFETLAATVGLADITEDRSGSAIQFRVLGDGRELWKSHQIQKPTDEATFSVSVVGVRELQLEVATLATNSNKFAHAVWLDPRLTPIAAPSTTPGGSSGANVPGIVYLDDLPEKDWQGFIELGKHGDKWKKDGSVINWQGAKPAHALTTYPLSNGSATVTYELGGRHSAFQAVVGITVTPRTPLTFRVFGDGKILWESPPQTKRVEAGVEVNVDLRGVETLKLEVLCPGDNSSAHAVWINPRLTPVGPVPPAANVVYLDDLAETSFRGSMALGKHGKTRDGATFVWQGRTPTHSLFTHPDPQKFAIVTYDLGGRYATFTTTVGLTTKPESPQTFSVFGDNKLLWKSAPLDTKDATGDTTIDVRGVQQLRLEVSSRDKAGGAFAVWINPRLTPVGPVPPAANIVYLDELTETSFHGNFLHKAGTAAFAREWQDSFKQPGPLPTHGVVLHSKKEDGAGRIVYDLAARYETLNLQALCNANRFEPIYVEVLADGRALVRSVNLTTVKGTGTPLAIDVRGVKELKIEIDASQQTIASHVALIDPRLTPTAQPEPAGVVYLDDLTEVEWKNLAKQPLGKHGKYLYLSETTETTILFRGKPVEHTLWMHPTNPPRADLATNPTAFARYQLDGRYTTFAAEAGIHESADKDPASPVTFRLLGDGRELWKSQPMQKRGESAEVAVDIRGVKELRLETASGERTGACHATWFMPRLTPMAASPGRWSLVETKPFDGELLNKVVPAGIAVMSHDGLAMLLPVGAPDRDLAMSTRATLTAPWSVVQNLGPQVNSQGGLNDAEDAYPAISQDQNTLVFFSKRGTTYTLWMAVRQQPTEPFGAATKLGPEINETGGRSIYPSLSANGQWLTFTRGTAQTKGFIAQRTTSAADFSQTRPLGPAIDALGTPAFCAVANDGLSIVMVVYDGAAGVSPFKLWTATRQRPDEPFTNPIELGAPFRGTSGQFSVTLSGDGQTLWCVQGKEILRAVRTALNPTVAVMVPSTSASSPAPNAFDRQVAQKLLDFKLPVKLKIAGKTSFVKPGSSLPVEPFVIEGIDSGAWVEVPRAELVKLLGEFRQLTSVENTFLPMKDCDLWAEAIAAMPSIKAVVAARCDELTDVGAAHLARLPKLEYLNIGSSVKLTATGLAAFEACKTLTTIVLCPEAVTAGSYQLADIQKLQNALPKTRIVFGGVKPIPGLVKPTN